MASSSFAKIRKDGLSTFAGSGVAVEHDACGTDPSALWTGEALGWRRLRDGTFFRLFGFSPWQISSCPSRTNNNNNDNDNDSDNDSDNDNDIMIMALRQ